MGLNNTNCFTSAEALLTLEFDGDPAHITASFCYKGTRHETNQRRGSETSLGNLYRCALIVLSNILLPALCSWLTKLCMRGCGYLE